MLIYPIGKTDACEYAVKKLQKEGISTIDHPTPEVTHLLLDVPSFDTTGQLRGGGDIGYYLERLPHSVRIVGGKLTHPALSEYRCLDLLEDATYQAVNAAITADCAVRVAGRELKTVFEHCPVLILGWGRIGKCLGKLLKAMGADVTIAARKEADVAMVRGLGYRGLNIYRLKPFLPGFRLIFNTVPEMVLEETDTKLCKDCIKIELASQPGMAGDGILHAGGLPGVFAPESSGILIAETVMKLAGRD